MIQQLMIKTAEQSCSQPYTGESVKKHESSAIFGDSNLVLKNLKTNLIPLKQKKYCLSQKVAYFNQHIHENNLDHGILKYRSKCLEIV